MEKSDSNGKCFFIFRFSFKANCTKNFLHLRGQWRLLKRINHYGEIPTGALLVTFDIVGYTRMYPMKKGKNQEGIFKFTGRSVYFCDLAHLI